MDILPLSRLNSVSQAQAVYYTAEFMNDIEGNLPFLLKNPSESMLRISAQKANMYKGDLVGLLVAEGMPASMHWITIRMNGYLCSTDYEGERTEFILPNEQVVTMIQRKHVMEHNVRL